MWFSFNRICLPNLICDHFTLPFRLKPFTDTSLQVVNVNWAWNTQTFGFESFLFLSFVVFEFNEFDLSFEIFVVFQPKWYRFKDSSNRNSLSPFARFIQNWFAAFKIWTTLKHLHSFKIWKKNIKLDSPKSVLMSKMGTFSNYHLYNKKYLWIRWLFWDRSL